MPPKATTPAKPDPPAAKKPDAKPAVPAPPPPPPAPPPKPKKIVVRYPGLNDALETQMNEAVKREADMQEFAYPAGAASKVRMLTWIPKTVAEQDATLAALQPFAGQAEVGTE